MSGLCHGSRFGVRLFDNIYTLRYSSIVGGGIEFEWDDENVKHLAAHKVTRGEFEQVMNNDPLDVDFDVIDGELRYLLLD